MIIDGDDGDPRPRILFSALLWGTMPRVFPTLVRPMGERTQSYRSIVANDQKNPAGVVAPRAWANPHTVDKDGGMCGGHLQSALF
jgi:hypothetical protein